MQYSVSNHSAAQLADANCVAGQVLASVMDMGNSRCAHPHAPDRQPSHRVFGSSEGDRNVVVQELMVAMRSASEDLMMQKRQQEQEHYQQQIHQQQRQQLNHQQRHDEDLGRLQGRLEASDARCSVLSQQLQQLQLQSQQLHAEDLRRANTLLQASESRGTALAQQLQVCHTSHHECKCRTVLTPTQSLQLHAAKVAEQHKSSVAAEEQSQQLLQVAQPAKIHI
jgi:hypothetical protein